MAIQEYDKFQDDPRLRDLAERREKFLRDVHSSQMTMLRRGLTEGRAESKREEFIKGRAEGFLTPLLKYIEWKLGVPSERLRLRLSEITDPQELNRLHEFAFKQAASLADIENEVFSE